MAMIMIANLQYAWTLFVEPIRQATGWKLSDIQWGFTLFIIFETWIMPLEGWLIDRMGPRIFTTIAGVLCGFGWSALAFATERWQLYTVLCDCGSGRGVRLQRIDRQRRSNGFPTGADWPRASSRAASARARRCSFPMIAYDHPDGGYRTAFLVTGIVQGLVMIAGGANAAASRPGICPSHAASKKPAPRVRRNTEQFSTREMLRTPHFYLLYVMFVMMATGGLLVTAQAGPVASEWDITRTALTAALALDRISNGASRVFWGWVSDHMGRENTMSLAFMLQAACLLSVLCGGPHIGNDVHRDLDSDVFHVWRGLLAVPVTGGRLFRRQQCQLQLQFPLQRQRRGVHHRRRTGGGAV